MATPTVTNLVSGFQARMSTKKLANLTNPGDTEPNTENTTLTTQAAVDAALRFEELSAKNYDDANVSHVQICIIGVEAMLMSYEDAIAPHTEKFMEKFESKVLGYFRRNKKIFHTNQRTTNTTPRQKDAYFSEKEWDGIRPLGSGLDGTDD